MTHFAFNVDYAGEVADSTPPPRRRSESWASTATRRDLLLTGQSTSVERSGFGFVEGETYWFSLQAQNSGGLWSASAIGSFVSGQGVYETYVPAVWRE